MKLKDGIRRWWDGKYVSAEDRSDEYLEFVLGTYERHWTSNIAHKCVEFFQREWKWIIGIFLTILGLVIAFLSLG